MRNRWLVVLVSISIIILWGSWFFLPDLLLSNYVVPIEYLEKIGLLGDSFGSLSSLFSALAFIGVLYTIYLQSIDIKQQKLDEARAQFERELFRLIDFYITSKGQAMYAIQSGDGEIIHNGHEAFRQIYMDLSQSVSREKANPDLLTKDTIKDNRNNRFGLVSHYSLGPYYRVLYSIFRMISTSSIISKTEKEKYGNLIRGLLSEYELCVISLACLDPKSGNMKDYVIEFRLLKYMRNSTFRKIVSFHYPATTFSARDS